MIEGCNMTGLLVPVSVVVVSHDIDVVEVLVEHGDVITLVDDLEARRNCRTQEKSLGLESSTEFLD